MTGILFLSDNGRTSSFIVFFLFILVINFDFLPQKLNSHKKLSLSNRRKRSNGSSFVLTNDNKSLIKFNQIRRLVEIKRRH